MNKSNEPAVRQAAEKTVDAAADAIKAAAKAKSPEPKAPSERKGKLERYTADRDVYVDGAYYKEGIPFVTDAPKSEHWTKVTQKEAAAIEASTDPVPDDANLEAADKSALQAVAIMKHVNIVGLDKPALITAIKAAYEPKL